jgi:hypothetical protein
MKASMPDYSGTHIDPQGTGAALSKNDLLSKFKEQLTADGNLNAEQVEGVGTLTELFKKVQEAKEALPDSLNPTRSEEKPIKIDPNQAKTFWDRLYGGVDFNWENSTGYYPDGLGIIFTGGYKITDNAGVNLEVNTLVNAGEIGWTGDEGFQPKFIANYSAGANLDHRIWKIFYAGMGVEVIVNTIEAPPVRFYDKIQNPKYTLGVPLILKAIVPIAGSKSTSIELRYDFNSQNNVKPKFDFQVGFLIGR